MYHRVQLRSQRRVDEMAPCAFEYEKGEVMSRACPSPERAPPSERFFILNGLYWKPAKAKTKMGGGDWIVLGYKPDNLRLHQTCIIVSTKGEFKMVVGPVVIPMVLGAPPTTGIGP